MRDAQAVTIWCDESIVTINNQLHHLIGTLITDSDQSEFSFFNDLLESRKYTRCWNVIHGNEIDQQDTGRINLLRNWIDDFLAHDRVLFHIFAYRENQQFVGDNFERYFARQSAFALANKMKERGYTIQTLLSNVGTVNFLFDRRRDEAGYTLGNVYENAIKQQLRDISGKGDALTVRFSFINSDCFNCMQLTDTLLYLTRCRIEKEAGNELTDIQTTLCNLWEEKFLDENITELKNFEYDTKYNFFLSDR